MVISEKPATSLVDSPQLSLKKPTGSEQRAKAIETILNPGRTALQKYTAPKLEHFDQDGPSSTLAPGPSRNSEAVPSASRSNTDKNSTAMEVDVNTDVDAERRKRHERWQKKLGQGLIAPRRNSLPLDQAAAESMDPTDPDFEIFPDDMDNDLAETEPGPSRGKARGKVVTSGKAMGKGKKKEEVGPSGMTYTPLEKQVSLALRLIYCCLLIRSRCVSWLVVYGDQGGEPGRLAPHGRYVIYSLFSFGTAI
jgi:hypothetical protein